MMTAISATTHHLCDDWGQFVIIDEVIPVLDNLYEPNDNTQTKPKTNIMPNIMPNILPTIGEHDVVNIPYVMPSYLKDFGNVSTATSMSLNAMNDVDVVNVITVLSPHKPNSNPSSLEMLIFFNYFIKMFYSSINYLWNQVNNRRPIY